MVAEKDYRIVMEREKKTNTLDPKLVEHHLKANKEGQVQQLVEEYSLGAVLRPKTEGSDTATSLHFTVRHGAENSLKVLLNSADLSEEDLEVPDVEGQTVLLTAVDKAKLGALQLLLLKGANINARDNNCLGALHFLVLALSSKSTNQDDYPRLLEAATILLSPPYVEKLDLEAHATVAGLTDATPLEAAVAKVKNNPGESYIPNLIKLCEMLVRAGALLTGNIDGTTVRQVLTENHCLTQELLNERRQAHRPLAAHVVDIICIGGSTEQVTELLQGKSEKVASKAVNSKIGSSSLLFRAVDTMNISLANVLLRYGANPFKLEVSGELPLHRAAANGHVAMFALLLKEMKGSNETLDLQKHTTSVIRKLMENSSNNDASEEIDHMACLRLLFKNDVKINLNNKHLGKTSLQVAASLNNEEAVKEMIQAGAYLGSRQVYSGKDYGSVMDTILVNTIYHAMDGCIQYYSDGGNNNKENVVNENHTLKLDYKFLLPTEEKDLKGNSKPQNESRVLMDICRSRRHRHLIKHPLLQTLLYTKWRKAIPHYLANVALYLFFVVVFTVFVYALKDQRVMEEQLAKLKLNDTDVTDKNAINITNNYINVFVHLNKDQPVIEAQLAKLKLNVNNGTDNNITMFVNFLKDREEKLEDNNDNNNTTLETKLENHILYVNLLKVMLLLAWLYILVREICQIIISKELYLKNVENYMEIFLVCVVVVLCFVPLDVDLTRHLAAWAMIFAWYEFVLVVGRAPALALYITMLRHVSWNFIKLILLFSALIFAFTISFNIILQPTSEDFKSFWMTLPKAVVMSTGEFEYSDLSEKFPNETMISTVLVFLVFLFVIFFVLMNVMIGLAVTDTQQVKEDAMLYTLMSRTELIYLVETFSIKCSRLLPCMNRIQVLSGPTNVPYLLVKINHHNKFKRVFSGKGRGANNGIIPISGMIPSRLDTDTSECLRIHRLNHLENEKKTQLDKSIPHLEETVRDLATNHPQLLRSLAAALRHEKE